MQHDTLGLRAQDIDFVSTFCKLPHVVSSEDSAQYRYNMHGFLMPVIMLHRFANYFLGNDADNITQEFMSYNSIEGAQDYIGYQMASVERVLDENVKQCRQAVKAAQKPNIAFDETVVPAFWISSVGVSPELKKFEDDLELLERFSEIFQRLRIDVGLGPKMLAAPDPVYLNDDNVVSLDRYR